VLLLDEPLAHVDKETAQIVEALVLSLSGQGTTVVMSSHNEELAQRTGSRVIRLLDGKVESMAEGSGEAPSGAVDGHRYAKL
jgi:ABC-type lipoprotein export system ATPase subunit